MARKITLPLLRGAQPLLRGRLVVVGGLTATAGVAILLVAVAAGVASFFEPENGTLTGGAQIVTAAGASGGKAVRFGTPAPTATPTPTPTPTTTPPPPSGWPNATNTGYKNAPGYPGHLTNYSPTANGAECSGPFTSGKTYHFCNFTSGSAASAYIGGVGAPVDNITFYGCRFASNDTTNANITFANGTGLTIDYSTIEPSAISAPPSSFNQGYQYGINQTLDDRPGNFLHGYTITVDHTNIWGFGNGMQVGYSTQAKPIIVRNTWFHDARADGGIDHTDAILDNDGGPQQVYMTFDHNTISSVGNTNGLALQYAGGGNYDHLTVTNNYFSGFGYTVNIGGSGNLTNSVFTDNTFGTDFQPIWGPLYGWGGTGNTWRRNKWKIAPGTTWSPASNDGKYWWPDGTLSASDYTGP